MAGSYSTLYADELSGSWNRNQLCGRYLLSSGLFSLVVDTSPIYCNCFCNPLVPNYILRPLLSDRFYLLYVLSWLAGGVWSRNGGAEICHGGDLRRSRYDLAVGCGYIQY